MCSRYLTTAALTVELLVLKSHIVQRIPLRCPHITVFAAQQHYGIIGKRFERRVAIVERTNGRSKASSCKELVSQVCRKWSSCTGW